MKIALILTDSYSAWHFRRGLIKSLIEAGHQIYVLTPPGSHTGHLERLGAMYIPIEVKRFWDPIGDIGFVVKLYKICREQHFDIVHNFSIKPNTIGAVAEKIAGANIIFGSVTGPLWYSKSNIA